MLILLVVRLNLYFNSIKVRLELLLGVGIEDAELEFQFHKGTIRTEILSEEIAHGSLISIP